MRLADLDVELVEPGIGVPINLPDVVARRVGTLVDVVAGSGAFERPMLAGAFAADRPGRHQRQAFEPAQQRLVDRAAPAGPIATRAPVRAVSTARGPNPVPDRRPAQAPARICSPRVPFRNLLDQASATMRSAG